MGQKDISEKILVAFNDVFADIVNVLLFNGECVIRPEELEDRGSRFFYRENDKLRDMDRDIIKRWRKGDVRFACIGIENQTTTDGDMPLRIIGYDGAAYRAQLSDSGYRIKLFEVAYLSDEQVAMFRSDFRIVADYFTQKRKNNHYDPPRIKIMHVEAVLQLLTIMENDDRFEKAIYDIEGKKAENMCDVLDIVEQRGREQGGTEREKKILESMFENGCSVKEISRLTGIEIVEIKDMLQLV